MRRVFWPALLLLVSLGFAQVNPPPTATAKFPKAIASGRTLKGKVVLTFAPEYHAYQNPPSDKFQIPVTVRALVAPFKLAKVTYPKGQLKVVAGSDLPSGVYEGATEIGTEVQVPTKPGKYKLKLVVGYQQCNTENCYPPSSVDVTVEVTVTKSK